MIDNPALTERLLARLEAVLPLPARLTPELVAMLQAQEAANDIPLNCMVTSISYAGDEGGIVCHLDFAGEAKSVTLTSITHLRFDPRLPLAREIAAYQTHRVRRLRRRRS
jgi:hypothetical protein